MAYPSLAAAIAAGADAGPDSRCAPAGRDRGRAFNADPARVQPDRRFSRAIGRHRGKFSVTVRGQWREALSLYGVAAAPSGSRKSAVGSIFTGCLVELESLWRDKAAPAIIGAKAQREILESQYRSLVKRGGSTAKGTTDVDRNAATAEAVSVATKLARFTVPAEPRILAEDASPEQITLTMAEQDGTIAVLSAEGTLLNIVTGRYSDKPNVDIMLKAFSGEAYRVDRINRPSIYLPRTHLAVRLAVQPVVLEQITERDLLLHNGFLARWLYLLPENLLGTRQLNPIPADERILQTWDRQVVALASYAHDLAEPRELQLSVEAIAALNAYRADHEQRLHPDLGDLAGIAAWGSKLPGLLIRIAALTTLVGDPQATVIDVPAMTEALALEPLLVAHARAAFGLVSGLRAERAEAVLRWIIRLRLTTFSGRDTWQGIRGQAWVDRADDVEAALAVLEDHDWIARLPDPQVRRSGRPPSPIYVVSPYLTGHYV